QSCHSEVSAGGAQPKNLGSATAWFATISTRMVPSFGCLARHDLNRVLTVASDHSLVRDSSATPNGLASG
ncbi:MAG TPA: hypothetical protein VKR29_09550, partial [Candidatus Binataceae bacterium]|nr:hypothetical protein [Candidatus Binataceae bacterium]